MVETSLRELEVASSRRVVFQPSHGLFLTCADAHELDACHCLFIPSFRFFVLPVPEGGSLFFAYWKIQYLFFTIMQQGLVQVVQDSATQAARAHSHCFNLTVADQWYQCVMAEWCTIQYNNIIRQNYIRWYKTYVPKSSRLKIVKDKPKRPKGQAARQSKWSSRPSSRCTRHQCTIT